MKKPNTQVIKDAIIESSGYIINASKMLNVNPLTLYKWINKDHLKNIVKEVRAKRKIELDIKRKMDAKSNFPFGATKEQKNTHVTLRVRASLFNSINDRCEKLGTTRTSFIENLIEKEIERC